MTGTKTGNITFQPGVSAKYRQKISAAYATIPPTERHYLEQQGVTIKVGVKPQDLEGSTHLRKAFRNNSGDGRTNINHCGGWYNPGTKIVHLSELVLTPDGKQWVEYDALQGVDKTLRHELGHAYEWNVTPAIRSVSDLPSASPKFMHAYVNDVRAAGGVKKLIKADLGYFVPKDGKLQSAPAQKNRCELFAELYASIIGSALRKEMSDLFPETCEVMIEFLERHQAARMNGPEAVRQFCRDFTRQPARAAKKKHIRKTSAGKLKTLWRALTRRGKK